MKICVLGLGYVGCVSAACFARNGHTVIGVDNNEKKVHELNAGRAPIVEPGLKELISDLRGRGDLSATTDSCCAISSSDIVFVCVGTPSTRTGGLDFRYLENVCTEIGRALKTQQHYTVIAIRSTLLPGSATDRLLPIIEAHSGLRAGNDFGFCVNPEFLREGSALYDFDNPPFTVIGEIDKKSGALLEELYQGVDAPLFRLRLGESEMIKYTCNVFHALKVAFGNEIGNICQLFGVDSHRVMDVFFSDNKLNISPTYLRPGYAFGGSCLGKDLRAVLDSARINALRLPLLENILPSNELHLIKPLELILQEGKRKVALIGLSFKPQTDDLRESPATELAERLIGKGLDLHIYDYEVSLSRLIGSNKAFLESSIPHISSLMKPSIKEALADREVVVVTKLLSEEGFDELFDNLSGTHTLIDLVRINDPRVKEFGGKYIGICW